MQSIVLLSGDGDTRAESNTCYDVKTNCAEAAEWPGGCFKYGNEYCKKVSLHGKSVRKIFNQLVLNSLHTMPGAMSTWM